VFPNSLNLKSEILNAQFHQDYTESLDLLVLSTACHTAINRNVYKLFVDDGWSVILVIPIETNFSSGKVCADSPRIDDPPILFQPLSEGSLRTSKFHDMVKILDELRPGTILIDNDPISFMSLEVSKWAKRNGSKVFCISCENLSLSFFQTIRRRGIKGVMPALFKRLLIGRVKRLLDGVFTINNEGTYIFNHEGFLNVNQIPLGIDTTIFHIDNLARSKIRSKLFLKGKVLGFFGRLTYEKGIHILIEALKFVKHYEWTLLMDEFSAYDNSYSSKVKYKISAAGLEDRIVFINPNHSEMCDYLNAVDLVIMPSISTPAWEEQYGRIAAEAMACGKPVVASRSGAIPNLLGGLGTLFPEGDVDMLSKILKSFLINDQCNNSVSAEILSEYAHKFLSIDYQKYLMKLSLNRRSSY
jgi:glycosyltransferase involved in cell wall biosynthesis